MPAQKESERKKRRRKRERREAGKKEVFLGGWLFSHGLWFPSIR